MAVAEAARNVVATGAEPMAITDCCNFGNPEKPEVYWQFRKAIGGMAYMLRGLNIPCVGGNVSFYNEDERTSRSVRPTTTIVMLGLIEKLNLVTSMALKRAGESIVLIGRTFRELGGSQYYRLIGNPDGKPPRAIVSREKASIRMVSEAIRKGYVTAAHDCSEGGLAIALAEMSIKGNLGSTVNLEAIPHEHVMRPDEILFSESSARFVLTTPEKQTHKLLSLARKRDVAAAKIGEVSPAGFKIMAEDKVVISCSVERMRDAWQTAIPKLMEMS